MEHSDRGEQRQAEPLESVELCDHKLTVVADQKLAETGVQIRSIGPVAQELVFELQHQWSPPGVHITESLCLWVIPAHRPSVLLLNPDKEWTTISGPNGPA